MNTFERVETKYLIAIDDVHKLKEELIKHNFNLDKYGLYNIQSLYYDTLNDMLALRSLEHPIYKEKLRLRCYGKYKEGAKLYLEIKKKYKGIVYKRRIETKQENAMDFINYEYEYDGQIGKEINFFRDYYKTLQAKVIILYEREAYLNSNIRITFDYNIRYRLDEKLSDDLSGIALIKDMVLVEIKTNDAYPAWLAQYLSENKIFKRRYSKYGQSYIDRKKGELSWKTYSNQYSPMV